MRKISAITSVNSTKLVAGLLLAVLSLFLAHLWAVSLLAAVSIGYTTNDRQLETGMVASLVQQEHTNSDITSDLVERASTDNQDAIIGIVVDSEDNGVIVASGDSTVLVQTEGEVRVFVTDRDGDIQQGDLLTISALRGVLSKVTKDKVVIATALQDYSPGSDADAGFTGNSENETEANVGTIRVLLNARNYHDTGQQPSVLASIGRTVTGKDVGDMRVLMAFLVLLLVLIVEGAIIYGAVSSTMTSMGRNPMAHRYIKREFLRVALVALTVLILGLAAVYLILNL